MDYLQYTKCKSIAIYNSIRWVLNLIINGLPSILNAWSIAAATISNGFKPYYKWITFNTEKLKTGSYKDYDVLNLIINGLPSILDVR